MATKANWVIDAGTTFSTSLNLTDQNGDVLNLTGYTSSSMIRRWYTSTKSISFNTSINTAIGTITLELDANVTSTMWPGRYVYDVEVTNGNTVSRVVEGIVTVTPAVTK